MERIPKPGEFYRHFKNKLYQVTAVAKHSETGEAMVVYQALYGDYGFYVRPLDMFTSEVDHEKYPEVKQVYRFEKVEPGKVSDMENAAGVKETIAAGNAAERKRAVAAGNAAEPKRTVTAGNAAEPQETAGTGDEAGVPNVYLLRFLDAETLEEKMACIKQMDGKVGQEELDSIYMALDMTPRSGDIHKQITWIYQYLETQFRYDGKRLRD